MSTGRDTMELSEAAIRAHYPAALSLLQGFDHAPRLAAAGPVAAAAERSPGIGARPMFRSTTPGLVTRPTARPGAVRLLDRIAALTEADLPTPATATAGQALRRALAVALAMAECYAERTPLAELKRANLENRLPATRGLEFAELLAAEALVVLQVFGTALAFFLAPHAGEATENAGEIDELLTDNSALALHGALWELDRKIAALDGGEARLLALLLGFAEALMARVAARAATAPRLEPFTGASWRVEAEGLTLSGFEPARAAKSSVLTMAFKQPEEVIGNHIAKYQAMKLAKMMMAYDFQRKLNPFAELGGFIFTFMGDGAPGTGKTTLIQMMAGLLDGYCRRAGYPFRYQNFSIDQIDSYQGKSGQNARAFVNTILDPAVIGFGTIDDIDQIAGKRGDRQSSAGQQEVTAVFMEAFAGANTVVRGNCTFGMFSNFPQNVDDALRQRAGARFLVDGPQSRADYIDILALLLGRNHQIPLGEHELYAAQAIRKAVTTSFEAHGRPQEAGLLRVWEEVTGQLGPLDTLAKLGSYLKAIQQADPRFTGRAIKNITDSVKLRALDVDLPDMWMEEPDVFLFQPYERKLAMLGEMLQPITVEMVVQEINRYADSEFRYADSSDAAAIAAMVRELGRSEEARRRYLAGKTA